MTKSQLKEVVGSIADRNITDAELTNAAVEMLVMDMQENWDGADFASMVLDGYPKFNLDDFAAEYSEDDVHAFETLAELIV